MYPPEHESLSPDISPGGSRSLLVVSPTPRLAWLPIALFCAITLPLIIANCHATRAESDQQYHLRTISQFANQFPHLNFADYPCTTTPGYHLVLTALVLAGLGKAIFLRLTAWLFSLGLVLHLTLEARKGRSPNAYIACLPLVASVYIVSSAVWILPDNAGWWGVTGILFLAVRPTWDWKIPVLGGLTLLLLVWIRQVHLWAAATLWTAAWYSTADKSQAIRRLILVLVATIPAFLTVLGFVLLWHGMMPPSMADEIRHAWYSPENIILEGPNLATPAIVLAVFGMFSCFFAELLLPNLMRVPKWRSKIGLGFLAGLFVAVVVPTDYAYGTRSSGIWNLAAHLPAPLHRSLLIIPLAGLGGAAMLAWWLLLPSQKTRAIWVVSWAAFTVAIGMNPSAFQRYFEPFCLLMLIVAGVELLQTQTSSNKRIWIGPCALAGLLAIVLISTIRWSAA